MLLPVGSNMSQNTQFSHTIAIWFQLQYDEQTTPNWSNIFIFILIPMLISKYNLYTSPTLARTHRYTTMDMTFFLIWLLFAN
jgi:hypothetical protein